MTAFTDFDQIERGKYPVILADPPWDFKTYSKKGRDRSPETRHYNVMNLDDIKRLPVSEIATKNSVLFLWVTWPFLLKGVEVLQAWGFEYKTCGFVFAKKNKKADSFFMGGGYYTRANTEPCLIGARGKNTRLSASVRQLIVEPVRQHSRKPDRVVTDIEALLSGPYIELFARTESKGWDVWGNETDRFQEQSSCQI